MNDQPAQPPYIYDGLDPAVEPKSAISEVSEAVMGAVNRVSEAIEIRPQARDAAEHSRQYRPRSAARLAARSVPARRRRGPQAVEKPRPPPGELTEAALEHIIAPRFAMRCGSS